MLISLPIGAQESPDTARFIGCYALTETSWEPSPEQPRDLLPDTIRLLGERGTEFPENGRLLVRPQLDWGEYRIAVWRPVGADSVEIRWSDGFVGYQINVGFDGLTGTGMARTLSDEVPSTTRYARVEISAVDCGGSDKAGRERDR